MNIQTTDKKQDGKQSFYLFLHFGKYTDNKQGSQKKFKDSTESIVFLLKYQ